MEMYNELKSALEAVPEITSVEITQHKYNKNNILIVHGPYDGCPGANHPVTKLIEDIAAKHGMEPDGWGWLYQFERVREWERNNPAPKDPRYNYEDRATMNMFSPSAKNPKNKAAKEILNKYLADKEAWQELKKNECPPSKDPGFTIEFAGLGHGADMERFYSGTRYFGD